MNNRKEIVKNYFKSWIDNDVSTFDKDALYIESWGPAYKGTNELKRWFIDWHVKSKVIIWDIKDIISSEDKIVKLKEFMSVLPIKYPYEK